MDAIANELLERMIRFFNGDVKRINHALKVHALAGIIAARELADARLREITCMAAVLHDIGIHRAEAVHGSSAGKYQEIEGPPIARSILSEMNVAEDSIDRVCCIIGSHHTYSKIDGTDFQVLVEADFLVNIFEDGMEKKAVRSIGEKYFKTGTGKKLLGSMYPG